MEVCHTLHQQQSQEQSLSLLTAATYSSWPQAQGEKQKHSVVACSHGAETEAL